MIKTLLSIVQYWEGKARFSTVMDGADKQRDAYTMNG